MTYADVGVQHQCHGTEEFLVAHGACTENAALPIEIKQRLFAESAKDASIAAGVLSAFRFRGIGCSCTDEFEAEVRNL